MQMLETVPIHRFSCLLIIAMLALSPIPSALADEPQGAITAGAPTVEQLHAEIVRLKQRVEQLETRLADGPRDDGMVIGLTEMTSKDGATSESDDWAERYWRNQSVSGN